MKIDFQKDSDVTASRIKKFEEILDNKTAVVLHHSEYCGHCIAMRDEFDKFKSETKEHVVEIEGGALNKVSQHKKIFSKVAPKDGQMYFPMILVFIRRETMVTPKKIEYQGPRTAEALKKFIEEQKLKHKSLKKKTTSKSKHVGDK